MTISTETPRLASENSFRFKFTEMKEYSLHKKNERPYFSWNEYIFTPIITFLITAIISYLSLYFIGIIFTSLLFLMGSAIINFIWMGYMKATPNGHHYRGPKIPAFIALLDFLRTYFIILSILVVINIGVYVLVVYQKENVFYETIFYFWLAVVFGGPISYFFYKYALYTFSLYGQALRYTRLRFKIKYDPETLILIDEVSFLNTTKKRMASCFLNRGQEIDFSIPLETYSISKKNDIVFSSRFSEYAFIPINTNIIKVACYAIAENTYYEDEVEFPYSKLYFDQNKYPLNSPKILRGKKTDTLTLSFYKKGKIKLFSGQNLILEHDLKTSKTILEEEKNIKIDTFKRKMACNDMVFSNLKCDTGILKRIEKRELISQKIVAWNLIIKTQQKHVIETTDCNNQSVDIKIAAIEEITTPFKSTLPYAFMCYCNVLGRRKWVEIQMDPEKLYDLLIDKNDYKFEIHMSLNALTAEVHLDIKIKGNLCHFKAWEKIIYQESLSEIQEKLHKENERNRKNSLWNGINKLIQEKEYSLAEEKCYQAIKEYPLDAILYFYEVRILFYLHGKEACYNKEAYFIEKTKHDPFGLSRIYNNYGCLCDFNLEYEKALPYFEKAAALFPEEIFYTANIAETYYKLKRPTEAIYLAKETQKRGYISDVMNEIINNKGRFLK